jgi:molybdopterin converting factor subunit 1
VRFTVLFFAQARDRAGRPQASFEVPDGSTLAGAIAAVRSDYPQLADLWPHLAVAVDGVLAPGDATLRDGAEIALLPPVSGG